MNDPALFLCNAVVWAMPPRSQRALDHLISAFLFTILLFGLIANLHRRLARQLLEQDAEIIGIVDAHACRDFVDPHVRLAQQPARALDDGTLFPVLNKPFYGRRGEPR